MLCLYKIDTHGSLGKIVQLKKVRFPKKDIMGLDVEAVKHRDSGAKVQKRTILRLKSICRKVLYRHI